MVRDKGGQKAGKRQRGKTEDYRQRVNKDRGGEAGGRNRGEKRREAEGIQRDRDREETHTVGVETGERD
jgi:hypothetical protein